MIGRKGGERQAKGDHAGNIGDEIEKKRKEGSSGVRWKGEEGVAVPKEDEEGLSKSVACNERLGTATEREEKRNTSDALPSMINDSEATPIW